MKRSRIRHTPFRRNLEELARKRAHWRVVQQRVRADSGGLCQGRVEGVCTRFAREVHHRRLRSQGCGDELENLLDLCRACHRWAHDNPAEAARRGLIVMRKAVDV